MNMAAVGVSVLGTAFGIDSPVTVIQMLWVNIIMDTLGSLAFAGEPCAGGIHDSSSHRTWGAHSHAAHGVADHTHGRLCSRAVDVLPALKGFKAFLRRKRNLLHDAVLRDVYFHGNRNSNVYAHRENKYFRKHIEKQSLRRIMPAVAAVQLLIIYFGGDVFRCVPLAPAELLMCSLFAFTVIPADSIRKSVRAIASRQK